MKKKMKMTMKIKAKKKVPIIQIIILEGIEI